MIVTTVKVTEIKMAEMKKKIPERPEPTQPPTQKRSPLHCSKYSWRSFFRDSWASIQACRFWSLWAANRVALASEAFSA
ncbi:MAG: hypothetical protein ACYTXE_40065 [Nostoc sp.]